MRESTAHLAAMFVRVPAFTVVLVLGACAEPEEPAGPDPRFPSDASVSPHGGGAPPGDAGPVMEGGLAAGDASALPPAVDASSAVDGGAARGADTCVAVRVAAVRPVTDQCRSCHNQYALAGQSRFVLTSEPAGDEASLQAAFKALGRDLMAMPAQEATRAHPGGKLLEEGNASYVAWDALLQALASPVTACVGAS